MTQIRLAIALINDDNQVKGLAVAEGCPRYAVRKAAEQAVRLCASTGVAGTPRIVVIPAPAGQLGACAEAARAMARAGDWIEGFSRDKVEALGRRLAVIEWLAVNVTEYTRLALAKPVPTLGNYVQGGRVMRLAKSPSKALERAS